MQILLWGGVLAGPLFIVVFLLEGTLRKGYNPWRQPVSALSIGPRGWVQQTNFFTNSVLLVGCAVGLHSILIGMYGAALFGAGLFITDADDPQVKRTKRGRLHQYFTIVVFASLFAATFAFANQFAGAGQRGWAAYSLITGILYGTGFGLFAKGFSGKGMLAPIGGFLQRLTISLGGLWLSAVSLHVLGIW